MASPASAAELISHLQLQPHPEGGHYRETYRSQLQVETPRGRRAASTAILFLLATGERSRWHRIASDEAWHHHGGGSLTLYEVTPKGNGRRIQLGLNLAAGERPQHVVAAGNWFAAEPLAGSPWTLVSCTVAPGFDFADFELARHHELAPFADSLTALCSDWMKFLAHG